MTFHFLGLGCGVSSTTPGLVMTLRKTTSATNVSLRYPREKRKTDPGASATKTVCVVSGHDVHVPGLHKRVHRLKVVKSKTRIVCGSRIIFDRRGDNGWHAGQCDSLALRDVQVRTLVVGSIVCGYTRATFSNFPLFVSIATMSGRQGDELLDMSSHCKGNEMVSYVQEKEYDLLTLGN